VPRLALVAAALVPSVVWSLAWGLATATQVPAEPLATTWGSLRQRLPYLGASVFGSHTLELRVVATALSVALVFAVALWTSRRDSCGGERARRALLWVAVAAAIAALLCPEVLMNTWGLWERIPPVAFVAFAGAMRWPASPRLRGRLSAALAAVAIFASATALAQGLAFSAEAAGIRELAERIPRGTRVMWSTCGEEQPWRRAVPSFKHLGAYVQAARGGDLSYSFAHFHHMVVHYRGAPLPAVFDRTVYDVAVLRLGPRCPPLDELRKLGPLAVRGSYVAFLAPAVTPDLAAAIEPEPAQRVRNASLK
jgi:hypothetical protein